MVEIEKDNNTRGIAVGGLTTGIIGSALGLLNNGNLGGILGGNCGCSEDHTVNRYEAGLQGKIASLETQKMLLEANTYSDAKLLEVYKYFDGENKAIRNELAAQAVTNQKTADSFALAAADLSATKRELHDRIQMEAERRCCADNAIVNYANATFYPKMVADVTVGTTTTAQTLYNPIPDCGCCGK